MTYFAEREYGTIYPPTGLVINGQWVVRNEYQEIIDCDRYLNDLKGRYPGLHVNRKNA